MEWVVVVALFVIAAGFVVLKQAGQISPEAARQHLQNGALVIDVRSVDEFGAGHLSAAVNIPLGEIREEIPRRAPDKNQVLLLHCLSGGRSGLARRWLRQMGYTRVYNLGSYRRAEKIAGR